MKIAERKYWREWVDNNPKAVTNLATGLKYING